MDGRRVAGLACVVGGLSLFADLALGVLAGLGQLYLLVAVVMALCLAGGPVGLWQLHSLAPGWRWLLGAVGSALVGVGILLWCTAFGLLFLNPSAAFTQRLTPGGSLVMSVGMVVLGSAVVASQRLAGWPRFVPLLVGLYFPLQLVVQLLFFLNGRDSAPGPNGLLLGSWGVCWALLGCAILSAEKQPRVPQPDADGSGTRGSIEVA